MSNAVVSTGEDVVTVGLLWVVYQYPVAAAGVAAVLLLAAIVLIMMLRRLVKGVFGRGKQKSSPSGGGGRPQR